MQVNLRTQVIGIVVASVTAVLISAGVGFGLSKPVQDDSSVTDVLQQCADDVRACGDGSLLTRNPNNNCQFDACPVVENTNTQLENSCCNQSDWYTCETEAEFEQGELACGQNACAICE